MAALQTHGILKRTYTYCDYCVMNSNEFYKIRDLDLSGEILTIGALKLLINKCTKLRLLNLENITIINDEGRTISGCNEITHEDLPIDCSLFANKKIKKIDFITDSQLKVIFDSSMRVHFIIKNS